MINEKWSISNVPEDHERSLFDLAIEWAASGAVR